MSFATTIEGRDRFKARIEAADKALSKPTAPSTGNVSGGVNAYRSSKGAALSSLPKEERANAEASLKHFLTLTAGPIARFRNGRDMWGPNKPAKAHLVNFRWTGDWAFKARVLVWLYKLERPVTEVAKAYLDILPQAEPGYSGPVPSKQLAALEDKGTLRFNLQPNDDGDIKTTTSFAYSDAGFNELGLTWGRMWADRYFLGQNTHIPEVKQAVGEFDDYLPHFEKRLKTLAKAVYYAYDEKRWWLYGHALRHSVNQYCRGFLAAYLVTGRADFKEAWLHFATRIQKEQRYGRARDGTPIGKEPHQYDFRKSELGWGGGSGAAGDADLTYDQENVEAQLDRYMMGDPYVTEGWFEAYANSLLLTSTPFGLGDDRMSEAICGSYKDRSLEGKPVSVLRWPDGKEEVVDVPGTAANRMTTFQNAVARRRGAHFDLTVFSEGDWLSYLDDIATKDKSDAVHLASCLVRAKKRDKNLLTRKALR